MMSGKRIPALLAALLLAGCATAAGVPEKGDPPVSQADRAALYPPTLYITGEGDGSSRREAESRALAALAMFFETEVRYSGSVSVLRRETSASGKDEGVSGNIRTRDDIAVAARVELPGVRFDAARESDGAWTALAFMNRRESAALYAADAEEDMREVAAALNHARANPEPWLSLPALRQALPAGEAAWKKLNMARLLENDAATAEKINQIQNLRTLCKERERHIGVKIGNIAGDYGDRLRLRLEKIFAEEGLAPRLPEPLYCLEGGMTLLEEERPGMKYNISGSLDLRVTSGTVTLFSYTVHCDRVGHNGSRPAALNMLYNEAEKSLDHDYREKLSKALGLR